MATYAIGDIQGCYKTLKRLLKHIGFNPKFDRIFLVGDLVNRGENSLDVLRWAYDLRDRITTVLGNHDLHLIGLALGVKAKGRKRRTLEQILRAKDRDLLIDWLRKQPLMHQEGQLVITHSGILPAWEISEARMYAKEAEKVLKSKKAAELIHEWYREEASVWDNNLEGNLRLCTILNAFTRMRVCKTKNKMDFSFVGRPADAPKGLKPWFEFSERKKNGYTIIFGHWAALGLKVTSHTIALDTGCVWGESLTAIRLEDGAIFSQPSLEK